MPHLLLILAAVLPSPSHRYEYTAQVTDVYDGDTITADIDLGFDVWLRGTKLRLIGIDAPEVRGPEREQGLVSRDWLRERIQGKEVTIRTVKDRKGKYGRWLAHVYLGEAGELVDFEPAGIAAEMVDRGLAERADY